jgi:AmiR/NasT family two-component response regulator
MLRQLTLVATPDPALRFLLGHALDAAGLPWVGVFSQAELHDALGPARSRARLGQIVGPVILDARRGQLELEPLVWLVSSGVHNPLVVIADEEDAHAHQLAEDAEASALFTPGDDPGGIVAAVQLGMRTRGLALALARGRRRRAVHAERSR